MVYRGLTKLEVGSDMNWCEERSYILLSYILSIVFLLYNQTKCLCWLFSLNEDRTILFFLLSTSIVTYANIQKFKEKCPIGSMVRLIF